MNVIEKQIGEIFPYENNPRNNESAVDAVAESIKQFGFKQPIVVDKDNVIIVGHTRWEAAQRLGLESVPVLVAEDLTEQQAKAYRLADNKTNELSGWDFLALDEELDGILDFDMTDFGFDEIDSDLLDDDFEEEDKTDVKYFSDAEVEQAIIDGWQTYKSAEDFCKNLIDKASAMYQFNRLCQGFADGYHISELFNAHRIDTDTKNSKSILHGWNNDENFKKQFARYAVEMTQKVTSRGEYAKQPAAMIGVAGYQYVNEFQPYLARDIYKRFVNDGDRVLDPCAGWGGRLLGIASCMFDNVEYWQTDPANRTFDGLVKLKDFLKLGDNFKQFNLPFEELDVKENYFDFVFTSPPYFDTEHYSDDEGQSYLKHDNYADWRDGFLYPMIDKILYTLKDGARCLLNVGNVRYPIDTDIEDYLNTLNVKHRRMKDFKIGGNGIGERTGEDGEPFILFVK